MIHLRGSLQITDIHLHNDVILILPMDGAVSVAILNVECIPYETALLTELLKCYRVSEPIIKP